MPIPNTEFVVSNTTFSQGYGISIKLLPGTFDVQAHELTDEDYVTLHGLGSSAKDNNTADVYLKLKSDQASLVIKGIGLAFEGATQVIDDYINAKTKIQGFRSLSNILAQHEFHFLFRDRGILPKAGAEFNKISHNPDQSTLSVQVSAFNPTNQYLTDSTLQPH